MERIYHLPLCLQENMAKEYGKDTVLEQLTMIEHHYWLWYSNYFTQIVAAVDVQSDK
ncbi:hypothetical protein [Coleofasciculus chthonoplastes]|nr:hypothetical protein [Coleofasciculus chthonoplastes]